MGRRWKWIGTGIGEQEKFGSGKVDHKKIMEKVDLSTKKSIFLKV